MAMYRITNTISGTVLGLYPGESEQEALDAMARDAGYEDHEAACKVAPVKDGELAVVPMEGTLCLARDVWAIGIHGVTGQETEEGWLAEGTLVKDFILIDPDSGELGFSASTDGGKTWHRRRTSGPVPTTEVVS